MTATESPASLFTRPSSSEVGATTVVLFGAAGDLARRKLLPGLYHLEVAGLLPESWRLIASSTRDISDSEFREIAREAVAEHGRSKPEGQCWNGFAERIVYVGGGFAPGSTTRMERAIEEAERALGDTQKLVFCAVPRRSFRTSCSASTRPTSPKARA